MVDIPNEFNGFPKEAFTFLENLKINNKKEWFEQHKGEYQALLLEPLKILVSELGDFMLTIDPDFEIVPAINRTISRIYRDTRFSKDKSPYKTTLWITFKIPNKNWREAPAYFFEISSKSYRYGMGYFHASPSKMRLFREKIDGNQDKFTQVISFYSKQSKFQIQGDLYKKTIDPTKPEKIQDWYQRKNLYLSCQSHIDEIIFSHQLVDELETGFKTISPLYYYMKHV